MIASYDRVVKIGKDQAVRRSENALGVKICKTFSTVLTCRLRTMDAEFAGLFDWPQPNETPVRLMLGASKASLTNSFLPQLNIVKL
jgi:hypothetical protein